MSSAVPVIFPSVERFPSVFHRIEGKVIAEGNQVNWKDKHKNIFIITSKYVYISVMRSFVIRDT